MSPENIHIRALNPEDWRIVKDIRLEALQLHHGTFGGSYEDAVNEADDVWRDTLSGGNKQVFGLFDNDRLIGITAVFTCYKDLSGETGHMAYTFLRPEYRKRGFSKLFYEARLAFAVQHLEWKKLVIGHRDGNEPSRRAMLAHGFEFTHKTRKVWPDGVEADEYHYMIDLEKLRRAEQ
jgi:RimJ/RimL family protein N-acetyltransferase